MSFNLSDNTYAPVGINKDKLIVLDTSTSKDNISLHSSNNDIIDIINIKTLLNKDSNKELHLSAFDGSTINPLIKINNTHQHVNIISNLNISHNLNIDNLTITHNSISTNVHPNEISFLNNTLTDIGLVKTNNAEINNTTINNGFINNTVIGNSTPSTGNFTTLNTTSSVTVNGDTNITGSLLATGNIGIGTQNPQAKLDVNGDIQFKSHNEFNNISNFFPGHYKSINSGTNIGLPLDFKPTVHDPGNKSDSFEEKMYYKKTFYSGMEITLDGPAIYTKNSISGYYTGPPTNSTATYNEDGIHGFYFKLVGTNAPFWLNNTYSANPDASNEDGYLYINLYDNHKNKTAVYKNKFTEISFDICHTNPFGDGGVFIVGIRNPDNGDNLCFVKFAPYVGYQFVQIWMKDTTGLHHESYFRVSSNKLLYNGVTDPGQSFFFNIRLVLDDELKIYFNNDLLITNISGSTGQAPNNTPVQFTISNALKLFINDSSYNQLMFHAFNGGGGSHSHIKNIQIKSGFGIHMCT